VYTETLRRHGARHEAKGHGFGYEIRAIAERVKAALGGGDA
jgi:DNA (cytosine-5)-methyltransferase 1